VYRWIVGRIARRLICQAVSGRPETALRMAAPDLRFVFPGDSSFAADYRDRTSFAAWLHRFAALKPEYRVEDVIVTGPPWNTRVAVRFHDRIGTDYENEGMQYLKMRWGKLTHDRIFLDTKAVADWEARHPELAASPTKS
jgi:ketosteroid isomerase-like protein